jgi:hypothetical protein
MLTVADIAVRAAIARKTIAAVRAIAQRAIDLHPDSAGAAITASRQRAGAAICPAARIAPRPGTTRGGGALVEVDLTIRSRKSISASTLVNASWHRRVTRRLLACATVETPQCGRGTLVEIVRAVIASVAECASAAINLPAKVLAVAAVQARCALALIERGMLAQITLEAGGARTSKLALAKNGRIVVGIGARGTIRAGRGETVVHVASLARGAEPAGRAGAAQLQDRAAAEPIT